MANALVRDLDDQVYERLKARAVGNNRSLEADEKVSGTEKRLSCINVPEMGS